MDFLKQLLDFGEEVSNHAPMSERIMMGIQTTLLGMGVVFAVLIILWAVLSVFKFVFYKGGEKKGEEKPIESASVSDIVPQAPPMQNDEELVAVITAAIASMLDAPTSSFRVVSFRRTAKK